MSIRNSVFLFGKHPAKPKTITCPGIKRLKEQGKKLFLLSTWIPAYRLGIHVLNIGLSCCLLLTQRLSWVLLYPLGFNFRSFQTLLKSKVFIRSSSLKSIRTPRFCSPALPPSAFRIFVGTRLRLCIHPTQKSFTVRICVITLWKFAPSGGTRRKHALLCFLSGEPAQ